MIDDDSLRSQHRPDSVANRVSGPNSGAVVQAATISGDVAAHSVHIAGDLHMRQPTWPPAAVAAVGSAIAAAIVGAEGGPRWVSVVLFLSAAQSMAVVAAAGSRRHLTPRLYVKSALVIAIALAVLLALPASRSATWQVLTSTAQPKIVQVVYAATPKTERITVIVRNPISEPTELGTIEVLAKFDHDYWVVHKGEENRHFAIQDSLSMGPVYSGAAPRIHGLVTVDGTEFTRHLAGHGEVSNSGWRRQLAFATGARLAPDDDSTVTIDIPIDLTVRALDPNAPEALRFTSASHGAYVILIRLETASGVIERCQPVKGTNKELEAEMCTEIGEYAASLPR